MASNGLFYRQYQRIKYHLAERPLQRRIAEINRFEKVVETSECGYTVRDVNVCLPSIGFDFIFQSNVFELFLKLPHALGGFYSVDHGRLFLKFSDLTIEITSQSELYIINEIFVGLCYGFALPCDDPIRVIDIGMNVGIASLFFAGLSHVKEVHGFEPFPKAFQQAQVNFRNNALRAEKIKSSNVGLGATNEVLSALYDGSNNGINSTFGTRMRNHQGESVEVNIRPAREILNGFLGTYANENFVLKIDAEGSEYPIFDSLFQDRLSDRVKVIMVEWHYRGSGRLERILLANDFSLTSIRLNSNCGLIYAFR